MTVPVKDQLRIYADQVTSRSVAIDIDELVAQGSGPPRVQPLSRYVDRPVARWAAAAAAAMAVLILVGGTAWLTQTTRSDAPVADIVVATTLAATDTTAQAEDAAASVFGHLKDANYWEAPAGGPGTVDEGRMEMSDERLNGNVTFIHNGEVFGETLEGSYHDFVLYWGTMLIENDGGTWEGTHFTADHRSQPDVNGPIVMQLTGSGDYEGLSAILYRTVVSPPGTANADHMESVDGMIFPGDLPPDRVPPPVGAA
jgi:hypothetical protein